jgi:hypothetical protein
VPMFRVTHVRADEISDVWKCEINGHKKRFIRELKLQIIS